MEPAADILDLVHESVVTCDADGRIRSWNKASERLYGWSREDALGCPLHALLASTHERPLAELEAQLLADGRWEGELERTTAAGAACILDVRWTVERDAGGAVARIIETARDISRRKAAEDRLRVSEYRYRNMFQAMAVAFWEVDFTAVGAMLIALRDQGVTDLRGHLLADRPFVRETMNRAIVRDVNANGATFFGARDPGEIVGRAVGDFWPAESEPVYIDALVATMTRQPHLVAETRLLRVDGEPVDVLFTVSLSQENRQRGVMLIGVVDITARKAAEAALAKMQADFAHAARVSMLGELVASIAHEVNQPLAAIATSGSASLRWLAHAEPNVAEVRSLAERIVADSRRAAAIIARVRAMAERREAVRVPLSLDSVIEQSLAFLDYELAAKAIAVVPALAPDLPPVLGDRTQLQQVIVNLAVNAMQAMAGAPGGTLWLSTARHADGRLALIVEDSGPGLSGDPARLFDSFYTTKPTGMGMGLPICRGIVEAHGGTIAADNSERGARFTVVLPAAADHTNVLPA